MVARGRLDGTMAYPLRVSSPSAGRVRVGCCGAGVLSFISSSMEGVAASAGSEVGSMELLRAADNLYMSRVAGQAGSRDADAFDLRWAMLCQMTTAKSELK